MLIRLCLKKTQVEEYREETPIPSAEIVIKDPRAFGLCRNEIAAAVFAQGGKEFESIVNHLRQFRDGDVVTVKMTSEDSE